jgi:hypothetical protein
MVNRQEFGVALTATSATGAVVIEDGCHHLARWPFIPIWRAFSGDRLRTAHYERHPRRGGWGGWSFIEQLAAIMGIITFIIQVAQWVYPWL